MYKRVNKLLGTNFFSNSDINWEKLSIKYKLRESFIREFRDKVDWFYISSHQKLSENFIREFKDKVNWYRISIFQKLSESFIREFEDEVSWRSISSQQKLSEEFIKEFKNRVDWSIISQFQVLSESFIREFQDKVDWEIIPIFQLLSWDFIMEFEDKIDWRSVSHCQPFIDPNYERINKKELKKNKFYHLYQETKDKGWFLGYVNRKSLILHLTTYYEDYISCIKSRIYWKDLIAIDKVKCFEEFIRFSKYV